jgi:O-antigen ligase
MISAGGIIVMALSLLYYAVGISLLDFSSLAVPHEGLDRGFYGLYLEGRMVRMRGLFDSPNNLALICVFLFFFYDLHKTKVSMVGKFLVMGALILTLSLTGWLSLMVAYVFGMVIKRQLRALFLVFLGVAVFIPAIYVVVPEDILNPMIEARMQRISTGSGRNELYELTLEKIAERPILGYGLNQARVVFKEHRGVQSTHNSFLEAAIDGGLVAVAIYVICWAIFLVLAFGLSWRNHSPFYFSAALGLFLFSQLNLLTFVELTVFYYALWFEIAARANTLRRG